MKLLDAIMDRRSIRNYHNKDVPESLIQEVIDKARWAPSACNKQGWRFLVIRDPAQRQRLLDHGTATFVKDAPVLILVLYDNRTDNNEYKDYIQSAAALIQNIHLIAHAQGLGSCWVNNLPPQKVLRRIFKMPGFYSPIALVTLGYPDEAKTPHPPARKKSVSELMSFDVFNCSEKNKFDLKFETRKFSKTIYNHLPLIIKRQLEPLAKRFERKFD